MESTRWSFRWVRQWLGSPLDRDEEPVADREQCGDEALVVAQGLYRASRSVRVVSSRAAGSATASCHSMLSSAIAPAAAEQPSGLFGIRGYFALLPVDDDEVVRTVGEPGRTSRPAR